MKATFAPPILLSTLWLATTSAGAINLAWDNCLGGAGSSAVKTFACDTNAGSSHVAYISMVVSDWIFHWEAFEWEVVLRSDQPVLPAWWQLRGAGQCRDGALSASVTRDYGGCIDLYLNNSSGGINSYDVGYGGPGLARLTGAFAVSSRGHADLDIGEEYFVARIEISNPRTSGSGACEGCSAPVCLEATRVGWLALGQWGSSTQPAVRSHIRWQGDDVGICQGGTPAVRSTWGALKSLYR